MKQTILILAAMIAAVCSAPAQKLSKEERKAMKEAEAARTAAQTQKLFAERCFKFIPESVTYGNGARNIIEGYEELAIRPDSFVCDITGLEDIQTNRYDVLKEGTEKTGFVLSVKLSANGAILTFNFVANSKTGLGSLRVKSNIDSDLIYTGTFKPF